MTTTICQNRVIKFAKKTCQTSKITTNFPKIPKNLLKLIKISSIGDDLCQIACQSCAKDGSWQRVLTQFVAYLGRVLLGTPQNLQNFTQNTQNTHSQYEIFCYYEPIV
ncbi:hypothetical protein B0680_01330 [Moraxella pluranimalium]|uniref:Uncharacterized protein n=1 Tax=Moraxella pluranimalium TaxID=470453 RepID=A0A1T0CT20_9GAMM|nr:hypothetical protein B0680_01330 [Moraxella pluranimalium]